MESKAETIITLASAATAAAAPSGEIQIAGVCFLGAVLGGFVIGQIAPPTIAAGDERRRAWMANIAAGGVGGAFLHIWLMGKPAWAATFHGKEFTLALGCGFVAGIFGVALLAALVPSLRKWIVQKLRNLLK